MPTTDPTLEGPSWSAPLNITYAWGDATTQSFVNPAGTFTSAITGAYQTLVQTAMHAWEAVTNVHFTLLSSTSGANIDIGWMNFTATAGQLGVTQYADYTDGTTNRDTFVSGTFVGFEDPAYRAVGGDQTSLYSGYNTTLYQVILHELGHALGLAHVNDPTMLMNPTLGASDRGISAGDVTNIQKIYGAPASGTPSVPTTTATIVRFSTDSGTSSTDFVTNVPAQTVTATLSAALASGESLMGSVNGGTAWTNITAYVSGTGVSWTGLTLSGISSIAMRVTNAAGNGPIAYQSYDIDTTPPTTTAGSIQISADSGSSSTDLVTNVAAPQTVTATLSAGLVSGEKLYGSTNGGLAWTDVTSKVSGTTVSWTGVTLQAGTSAIAFRVGDLAGNFASTTSQAYTLDVTPPTTAVTGIAISADSGASGTDLVTNVAAQTITATLGAALAAGDRLYGSVDGGATWADVTNKVSGTSVSWSGATLLAGTRNVAFRVVDLAGNAGPTSTQAYTLDVTPPIAAVTGPIALSNDSGVVGDFVTNVANQSISASLNGALSAGDRLLGSTNGGATWSDVTGGVNATTVYWTGAVLNPGTSTLRFKIVDLAGNAGAVTTQAYTLTTTPPATGSPTSCGRPSPVPRRSAAP